MQASTLNTCGSPSALKLLDIDKPEVKGDEVLV